MSENTSTSELIDFRALLRSYRKNWYWFVISIVGFLGIGIFASYLQQPKYEVRASVILNGENGVSQFLGGSLSGVASFFGGNSSVADEASIMTAHSILRNVAINQGLTNVVSERMMPLVYKMLTKEQPVLVVPDESTILTDTLRTTLKFKLVLANKNELKSLTVTNGDGDKVFSGSKLSLPAKISTGYGDFTVMTTPFFNDERAMKYRVLIKSPDIAAEDLRKAKLSISQANKASSIIELEMITNDEELAKNILNDIVETYNATSRQVKKFDSGATARFLQDRLDTVRVNLAATEAELQQYKKREGLGMVEADGQSMYTRLGETEKLLTQQQAQTEMARIALEVAKESAKDNSTVPPLTDNQAVAALVNSYNSLVLRRAQLASAVKPDNQALIRLDDQIAGLRNAMIKALDDAYLSTKSMEAELRRTHEAANRQIKNLPDVENSFRRIARNQEIEEQLYIFLLQKQEEINVLFNDNRPKARVIDTAYSMNEDISMDSWKIILICLLLGLLLPPVAIYCKDIVFSKNK